MLNSWKKTQFSQGMVYYMENETGKFYCDETGTLLFLETAKNKRLNQPPFGYYRFGDEKNVQTLILPEGIKIIGKEISDNYFKVSGTLSELIIIGKLDLPKTLEKLEKLVLHGCLIMEMELPISLREIGPSAVMESYIHILRIPRGMPHPQHIAWDGKKATDALTVNGRQFKGTIVDTLIVPRDYPYRELFVETKINHVIYID